MKYCEICERPLEKNIPTKPYLCCICQKDVIQFTFCLDYVYCDFPLSDFCLLNACNKRESVIDLLIKLTRLNDKVKDEKFSEWMTDRQLAGSKNTRFTENFLKYLKTYTINLITPYIESFFVRLIERNTKLNLPKQIKKMNALGTRIRELNGQIETLENERTKIIESFKKRIVL